MTQGRRIVGLLALVLLISAPVTWLVSRDLLWLWFKLLLGLGLGGVWLLAALRSRRHQLQGRGFIHAFTTSLIVVGLLVIGGVGVAFSQANALSFDLTDDQVYTLAPQTQALLQKLPEKTHITAYFKPGGREAKITAKLVEQLRSVRSDLRFELVDPERRPDRVKEDAILADGPRIVIRTGTKDTRIRQATEQAMAQAFQRLTGADRPLYFLSGHGEAKLEGEDRKGFARLGRELKGEGADLRYLNLLEAGQVPADARALILLNPRKNLETEEKRLLNHYLAFGGRLLLFLEPNSPLDTKVLFPAWGIGLGQGRIVDPSLASRGQTVALGSRYGEHPVVKALGTAGIHTLFPSAAPVEVDPTVVAKGYQIAALIGTGNKAWAETNPGGLWQRNEDEAKAPLIAAMTFKDTSQTEAKRSDEARLLLLGDSDFLTNSGLNEGGNRDFILNLIASMSDDEPSLELHANSRRISRILLTEEEQRNLQLLVLDLVPLAFLLPGLVIWVRRRGHR
jgi:hypothetical protein|tara:strand:- start:1900 stop:3426 length:1527 start_codon:yes stop_codon:yes gene_type:complete